MNNSSSFKFDVYGNDVSLYLKPRIPVKPALNPRVLYSSESVNSHPSSVISQGQIKYVTSGRVAIAHALIQLGVTKGDNVLVPAYHCSSMIEPVDWRGATPLFYKITHDLKVDLDHVGKIINNKTCVMIATHYFGFPQKTTELRKFCDQYNIALIEDCAHAFFGENEGKPIGHYADFSIASPMKIFPIYDGGCLVSRKHSLDPIVLHHPGLSFEIKAGVNILEQSFQYGRMPKTGKILAPFLSFKDRMRKWSKKTSSATTKAALSPAASDGGFGFEPAWVDKKMSVVSKTILMRTDKTLLVGKRCEHFQKLHTSLSHLPHCKPLYNELPQDIVPYVYPLLMEFPEKVFAKLKLQGIPIIRFGEYLDTRLAPQMCPVSADLSKRLFQFPCHHDLSKQELDWMIDTIITTLNAA